MCEEGRKMTVTQQIVAQVEKLPLELQRRVLDFVNALALSQPKGVRGEQLLRFAGIINTDDLLAMAEAIEESCERVDWDEW